MVKAVKKNPMNSMKPDPDASRQLAQQQIRRAVSRPVRLSMIVAEGDHRLNGRPHPA
ncbi:MAG: hypothetical protein LCH78_11415 [Proteobacteria bacterium]|nr:hypothetical protein [Pseudomonadota bacterium]